MVLHSALFFPFSFYCKRFSLDQPAHLYFHKSAAKKGLACRSCAHVPYAMDGLGNRSGYHLVGGRTAVFNSGPLLDG
jgi:hypothetical protein